MIDRNPIQITAYDLARRFVGVREVAGAIHNPEVVAMLKLVTPSVNDDETAWCSAFANYVAHLLDLPRSNSLAARSWLKVGTGKALEDAKVGFDVVVLKRGGGNQPGPEVLNATGHVGFYAGTNSAGNVMVLGGNQDNAVTIAPFPASRILGIRAL